MKPTMTKSERIEMYRQKLATDDHWILRGLFAIYQRQTQHEQDAERTEEHNGVGFTGTDGELLTSFTHQMLQKGFVKEDVKNYNLGSFFSRKQAGILRKRMPKYAGQLDKIAHGEI